MPKINRKQKTNSILHILSVSGHQEHLKHLLPSPTGPTRRPLKNPFMVVQERPGEALSHPKKWTETPKTKKHSKAPWCAFCCCVSFFETPLPHPRPLFKSNSPCDLSFTLKKWSKGLHADAGPASHTFFSHSKHLLQTNSLSSVARGAFGTQTSTIAAHQIIPQDHKTSSFPSLEIVV